MDTRGKPGVFYSFSHDLAFRVVGKAPFSIGFPLQEGKEGVLSRGLVRISLMVCDLVQVACSQNMKAEQLMKKVRFQSLNMNIIVLDV